MMYVQPSSRAMAVSMAARRQRWREQLMGRAAMGDPFCLGGRCYMLSNINCMICINMHECIICVL